MTPHIILKDFTGNQTGYGETEAFVANTVRDLSDSLAAVAVGEGWAQPAIEPRALAAGETLAEGNLPGDATVTPGEPMNPADLRETKVVAPDETKPAKPLNKMSKAELVAYALDTKGLELAPDSMTVKAMIDAIEQA